MKSTLVTAAACLCTFSAATLATAQDYDLTQIPMPANWSGIYPLAINDNGHVVGINIAGFFQMPVAFYFDGEETHIFGDDLLATLPYEDWQMGIRPLDINNDNHVLFTLEILDVGVFSYIWDGENYSEIAPTIPPGNHDFADASAGSINNHGQVAGAMRFIINDPPTLWYRAFVWDSVTGETTMIETPAPFTDGGAYDISDTGYVTGFFSGGPEPATAYIWKDGEISLFVGTDENDYISISQAVNDDGFAGAFTAYQPAPGAPSLGRVYLWSPAGPHEWADPTDGLNTIFAVYGISNDNQIVGTMGGPQQPFHFHNGVMRNLNNHITSPDPEAVLDLWDAYGINNNGQIIAHGQFIGTGDWTNYGFILTPKNGEPLLGDLNNDGVVDVFDLLILLAEWGQCPATAPCDADLDGNGVVDVFDLLILLANWS